ncbi:MAG: tRNA pseudouridine(38-40) synthase TruA [Tindallia sp. MSAO_Bac2]|nr:MAG: tRNA pseudouridine(38-40) synthase TruA [Tindallia sp. MSAO_Bac2]
MRNMMITIEYDGSAYNGWQIQPNGKSIQEEIIKALRVITKQNISVHGAGRTDAKVHAYGQCASFKVDCSIPTEKFSAAINSQLPEDIVVKETVEKDPGFHARFSAAGKQYEYKICNQKYRSAINRNYKWHVSKPLDLEQMKHAVNLIPGTHDFSQFMASGSDVKDTVRNITRAEIVAGKARGHFSIIFEGNGFLYKMVRMLVAAIVEIGMHKSTTEELYARLTQQTNCTNRWTAPPQGLYLNKVYYKGEEFNLDTPGSMV